MRFLHSRYFGIPLEVNEEMESTCKPLVKLVVKRLSSWRFRFVKVGGNLYHFLSIFYEDANDDMEEIGWDVETLHLGWFKRLGESGVGQVRGCM